MWFRRPPPRRSRVTHMDREESVPLDGAWNMHWMTCTGESMALAGGGRGGTVRTRGRRPRSVSVTVGDGDSLPIRLGGRLLDIHDLVPQLEEALGFERAAKFSRTWSRAAFLA